MIPRKWKFVPFALFSFAISCTDVHAQWLNYPAPGTPLTPDGKPNLTAPAPRAIGGKPDLSGTWHAHPASAEDFKRVFGAAVVDNIETLSVPGMELNTVSLYAASIFADFKPGDVPMRPAAAEIFRRRVTGAEPLPTCLPLGIPVAGLVSEATKFIQSPAQLVVLYESDGTHRQIYTDGRTLPQEIIQPAWLGYSAGRWDRDTLVVESAGFNNKTWLDILGHPHSEALHITERYRRRDFGHMDVEMTFDDPEMYTRPFSIKYTFDLLWGSDVFENICNENEKDRIHTEKK
jgi:hypothetical protein